MNELVSNNHQNSDNEIFKYIFEKSFNAILLGAPDGTIYEANEAAQQMFGYNLNEIRSLGRNPLFDTTDSTFFSALKTREETGKFKGELIGIRKNGERFPIEMTSTLFKNKTGEYRTSNILIDITERKNAENELRLLLNNTEESFALIDTNLNIVSFNNQFAEGHKLHLNINVKKGDCILDYGDQERRPKMYELYKRVLNGENVQLELNISKKIGIDIILLKHLKPAIDHLGNIIGVFTTSKNISELKKTHLDLKKSHEQLTKLTDSIDTVVYQFEMTPEGKMTFPFVSKSVYKMVPEIDIEQLKHDASPAFSIVHPDDIEGLIKSIHESRNNLTSWNYEYRHKAYNGKQIWIKGSSHPTKKDDGTVVWYGYLLDITTKVLDNEKLRLANERFDIIAKATNDTIWDCDLISNTIYWAKGILGYPKDSINTSFEWWFNKIHPEDIERVRHKLDLVFKNQESRWEDEFRFKASDGTYKYVYDRGFLVIHDSIPVRMVGAMQDITERKNTELRYKESEQRFKAIFDAEPECVKLIGSQGELIEINAAGIALHEANSVEEMKSLPISDFIVPQYQNAFNKLHRQTLNGQNGSLEFEIIGLNGTRKWLEAYSAPIKDINGNITMMLSVTRDISNNKASEIALKESEKRFRTIFETVPECVKLVSLYGEILEINSTGLKMLEAKSLIEVKSKSLIDYVSPEYQNDFKKLHQQAIKGKNNTLEFDMIGLKGTKRCVETHITPMRDTNNKITLVLAITRDISNRKKIEKDLKDSEDRYRTLVECSPDPVAVHTNGNIVYVNPAAIKMFGAKTEKELLKKTIWDIVHPEFHPMIIKRIENTLKNIDNSLTDDYKLLMMNGTEIDVVTKATTIIYDGKLSIHIAMKNVTKQKKENQRLKLLESVITNTNDAIIITNAKSPETQKHNIIYVNNAFTKMTGYTLNEILNKSPKILQGPNSDKNELKRLSDAIKNKESCEINSINYKKNGEEYWMNMFITPVINEENKITHWIAIEKDITSRKNNEIERELIIAELSQNNKDLKQFSYVTSHNLRAPIANLLGLSTLLDNYKIPNRSLKQILDGIKQSALMFDETVKDLAQVLIIKDQTNLKIEQISLVSIINKILSQLSITVDDNEVKINYDFKNAPSIHFTSSYLESIFMNLFTNALKYKSQQRKLKIDINSINTEDFIVIKFKDNGIGLDVERHREKIFKLYQRFHDNADGKGLGLYLVKSQMEALGGQIDLESEVGKGTTFILKFKKCKGS